MKYLSEREYNFRMKRIQRENLSRERKRMLKAEKRKGKKEHRLPSTSKLVLLGMILLCVQIVIFCEYAMIKLYDASSMYVLIGIPVALAPIIWGYYSKAKAENTEGGITYMAAMEELRHNYNSYADMSDEVSDSEEFDDTTSGLEEMETETETEEAVG